MFDYKDELKAVAGNLIDKLDEATCTCGNPEFGFDCVCDWVEKHQGTTDYSCEYCGLYTAGAARCSKCEAD